VRPNGTGGPAASEPGAAGGRAIDRLIILVAIVAGIAIRLWLLPMDGLRGDLDQFVGWVHHIATRGFGTLYGETAAGPVTFGPVMGYVWALLAAVQPAFGSVTDAGDPAIRVLMKLPATIADFGIAAVLWFAWQSRPRWAAIAVAVIMLHPVVFYVSAWWGQYESIYVLTGLAAVAAAGKGRNGLAAALIAVSVMTKPQAIPFLLPFAAWFWATGGPREVARAMVIGAAVIAVLWLPFIPAGGPLGYIDNVREYSSGVFGILSLRAWNPWWIVQEVAAGGEFIRDDIPVLGPLTLRHVGYAITGVLSLIIAAAILRDPTPRRLVLGLAASVLVFFTFMTQMHERYAYAAFVLLLLALDDRWIRWIWAAFGTLLMLDLFSAAPATAALQQALLRVPWLALVGSVAMTAVTIATLLLAVRSGTEPLPEEDRRATLPGT
jgi:Gpi18-like mannosyltransferase